MNLRKSGIAAAVFLAALGVTSCGEASVHDATTADVANGEVLTVEEVLAPDFRIVAAVTTNRDVGDARARIGGKLSRLLVRDGDQVKRGEVVAVITDERIEAELRAAQAAVAAAQANADRAAQDLERAEKLFTAQAISRSAIDSARADASSATANLKAAQAQAAAAQAVKDQGRVTAPADGRVTRAATPQGAVVMAGEVVVNISTGAHVLRIELPESDGRNLQQGEKLRLVLEEDGEESQFATVRQVYPAVTRGRVMADLDAPGLDESLIGARVRVAVPLGQRPAIVIPESYIVTRFGADYVRLLRAGGAVIEAPVQRGAETPTDAMPDGVEILSGLRAGDQIIPAGAES
ncbi:MAG: efflux RND transporter periplasmic adaptor subunit [Hyphomonadaceae bacterium]